MAWEVDWSRRKLKTTPGKKTYNWLVWARHPESKWRKCRDWHWTTSHTLRNHGVRWVALTRRRPQKLRPGRVTRSGYVYRGPWSMTPEEVALADQLGLWYKAGATAKPYVYEHRLIAAKKYGSLVVGRVVRHLNGNKADNRPENLVLGTFKENTADHVSARTQAMYWRERAEKAEAELEALNARSDGKKEIPGHRGALQPR